MSIEIKNGSRQDIPAVLAMIKELAEFERAPEQVTITEEQLAEDGFGEDPAYSLLVAELNGDVAGFALYYSRYSTWKGRSMYLEDLLVKEQCRKQGVGSALFEAVMEQARAQGVQRLEWQVLNWNTDAIQFYKNFNASFDDEWINGRLTYEQLHQSNKAKARSSAST